jgi:antitoxin HicB
MAKQTEYEILVEPPAETDGGGWLTSVPALAPGCMGDRETREAALVRQAPRLPCFQNQGPP